MERVIYYPTFFGSCGVLVTKIMAVMKNHGHLGRISQYNTRVFLMKRFAYVTYIAQIVLWYGHIISQQAYHGICL